MVSRCGLLTIVRFLHQTLRGTGPYGGISQRLHPRVLSWYAATFLVVALVAASCTLGGEEQANPTATPTLELTRPFLSPTGTPTVLLPPDDGPVISPSPMPTATPSPTRTLTSSPTLTPTPTTSPSPTPTPTSTPTVTPTPTSTPIPVPDLRYGVILHMEDPGAQGYFLEALGVQWYLDYHADPAAGGFNKVLFVSVKPEKGLLSPGEIAQIAQESPGSYWYLGGETNVEEQDGLPEAAYAEVFHYYWTEIKGVDPTAMVMSASVLNWDFTCLRPENNGCSWDYSGREWVEEFRAAYLAQYLVESPVDLWSLDAYPLD